MYLVVSYKPSHDDYVRGCYMGSYNSRHEMKVFHKEEDIIEHCAQLEAELRSLDTEYNHWIITQDMIGNGYNWFDSCGKLPKHIEEKVADRVKQLKGA
jgi:hypothetical protein